MWIGILQFFFVFKFQMQPSQPEQQLFKIFQGKHFTTQLLFLQIKVLLCRKNFVNFLRSTHTLVYQVLVLNLLGFCFNVRIFSLTCLGHQICHQKRGPVPLQKQSTCSDENL